MTREPIPTWFFALVVVRRGDQFLVVHEKKHGQLWYLPAGRVESGETMIAGAVRETLEESGVPVEIDGILRVQHTPTARGARVRVIFTAKPTDDTPPLSAPNKHSLEARWVTLEELEDLPLRGKEVRDLFASVAHGESIYPLSLLGSEARS